MPYIDVNDQQLYYAGRGLDRRPLFLLIHGAAGSHLDWPAQLRAAPGVGICAIDLPGHGRSRGPGRWSISAYAADIMALIELLGLSQIVLVGHSMGGAVALTIALDQLPSVAGLVLVATGARLKVKSELRELVKTDYDQAVELVSEVAWSESAPVEVVRRGRKLMLRCDPSAVAMDYTACNGFDVMTELASISVPTLVLSGTKDRLTPPKYGEFLATHIPGAEYVAIPGAGHMLAQERPSEVAQATLEFARRWLGN